MATKEIKWGQRCIARKFENCDEFKGKCIDKECIVTTPENQKGEIVVAFETGQWLLWPISALEPIPETPDVWWPNIGDKVMHEGKLRTVTDVYDDTHELDNWTAVNYRELSPVPNTEITLEEAIALLEQNTGLSYKIKGV